MISLKNIYVTFGKGAATVKALNDVSIEIEKGDFVTITGKSGCGKSTLLNVLGGILKPDTGEYFYEGRNVYDLSDEDLAVFRNRNIGFVVQHFALINEKNVLENIMLPLKYRKEKATSLLDEYKLLDRLELNDKKRAYPTQLSGGQKQRVAIARALIGNPEVIIADEPTGSLDEETGERIAGILSEINKEGKTVIMVTHDVQLSQMGNKRIIMRDGKTDTACRIA